MSTDEERAAENAAFLERLRSRIKSPSLRNPYQSWHTKTADLIERQLQQDGHRTWGFVIYRTTYDNDADWAEFLRRLRAEMEQVFDHRGGRDILDVFSLAVVEDREKLDGADSTSWSGGSMRLGWSNSKMALLMPRRYHPARHPATASSSKSTPNSSVQSFTRSPTATRETAG